jgi:hypothetical protein
LEPEKEHADPFMSLFERKSFTEAELLQIAQLTCKEKGWAWKEPVRIVSRCFTWLVITNANYLGQNALIKISRRTGKVISCGFSPR